MDTQTVLNIVLSAAMVILSIKNFSLSSKKDTQRESQEMTEIRVKLSQVMDLMRDLQKDVRTSTADFRALSDRVLIIEERLSATIESLEKMKGEKHGKRKKSYCTAAQMALMGALGFRSRSCLDNYERSWYYGKNRDRRDCI